MRMVKNEIRRGERKHQGNNRLFISLPFLSDNYTKEISRTLRKTGLKAICVSVVQNENTFFFIATTATKEMHLQQL